MCVHWISYLLTSTFKKSIILKLFTAGHLFFQWCSMILKSNFSKNFSTLGEFSKDLWAKEVTVRFFFYHSYPSSCCLITVHYDLVIDRPINQLTDRRPGQPTGRQRHQPFGQFYFTQVSRARFLKGRISILPHKMNLSIQNTLHGYSIWFMFICSK